MDAAHRPTGISGRGLHSRRRVRAMLGHGRGTRVPLRENTMKTRVLASYGAIAAATLAAAFALTACEPAGLSVATPDYGAALDWSQPPPAEPKT
jgi:hypothetical protein